MLFNTVELSVRDQLDGMILTDIQKQVLQNRRAELAQQIVMAKASRSDLDYFDKLNFQKGQIEEITNMLTASDQAQEALNNSAQQGN